MTCTATVTGPCPWPQVAAPAASRIPIDLQPFCTDTLSARPVPYLYQIGECIPGNWRPIQERSVRKAACQAAVAHYKASSIKIRQGYVVHVMRDDPLNRWPNGNPKIVNVLTLFVGGKDKPVAGDLL